MSNSTKINIEGNKQVLEIGGVRSCIRSCTCEELTQRMRDNKLVFVDSGSPMGLLCGNNKALNTNIVVVPGGEESKSKAVFNAVLDTFFAHTLVRSDTVYVIGGGALCDTVSYAASVYMRGIKIVLVPSTLLAMVDATIGGKTAINYSTWKNMVGTFYPASEILVCPYLLSTLSVALLRAGLAEIIKAGMLRDPNLLVLIEEKNKVLISESFVSNLALWTTIIWKAIKVKVAIVQEDFMETGIRAFLNLGHTFAHAHEACARKNTEVNISRGLSHGDAVGLGLRASLVLGSMLTKPNSDQPITNEQYAKRIIRLLNDLEYPNSYNGYSSKTLLEAMTMDKKRGANSLQFIVQSDCANTQALPVEKDIVIKVLQQLGAE